MSKRKRHHDINFNDSLIDNETILRLYIDRLIELGISMFKWKNLPDSIDERYLEMTLLYEGKIVFFKDDVLNNYLALKCITSSPFDVYNNPINITAIAANGYNANLTNKNSVIIYNNYLRTNSINEIKKYAKKLYNLDRAIDVNINSQKTPVLLQCDQDTRLTLLNLYEQYEGNQPFIFGNNGLDPNCIKSINTGAPFVCDKLYMLKNQIWDEALAYLGITNQSTIKKERLITDEVIMNQQGTLASRYTRLGIRKIAAEQINKMFDLNIEVDYNTNDEKNNENIKYEGSDNNE